MSAVAMLLNRARASKVFKRNKVDLEIKILAALIYFSGLSYRKVSSLGNFSYEAVRLWYNALRDALPKPERRYRRCIAVDETKTKLGKEQLFVWAARDVDSKEVLAYRVSFTRSCLDAELFLKDVLQYCENKPIILVDKGPWYKDALKSLGLKYDHQTFGERNRIERWFRDPQSQAEGLLQPLPSQCNDSNDKKVH